MSRVQIQDAREKREVLGEKGTGDARDGTKVGLKKGTWTRKNLRCAHNPLF